MLPLRMLSIVPKHNVTVISVRKPDLALPIAFLKENTFSSGMITTKKIVFKLLPFAKHTSHLRPVPNPTVITSPPENNYPPFGGEGLLERVGVLRTKF